MWVLILQAINALHDSLRDKWFGQMRVFSMYTATANESKYCASLQTNILSVTCVQMLMYTLQLCVKSHSREFFDYLDRESSKSGKFLLKLRTDHLEKFAPRKINLPYGKLKLAYMAYSCSHVVVHFTSSQ